MSRDRDTDHAPPDSRPDEEVYVENEEGEPTMAGRTGDDEGVYWSYPDEGFRVVDPKVYGPVVIVGAILLLFPEPVTSALGIVLLVTGAFVAGVDLLT